MSLILSGTNGLSDVDGTAATPAIRGTDANTGIFFPAADTIAFSEGGVEAMRLDSSGNLGLGVTPSAWGSSYKAIQLGGTVPYITSANQYLGVGTNFYRDGSGNHIYTATLPAANYTQEIGAHKWFTAPSGTAGNAITFTQAMTLDASGRLLLGQTTGSAKLDVKTTTTGAYAGYFSFVAGGYGVGIANPSGGYADFLYFFSPTYVGNVYTTGSTTVYASASDYRLKEDIQPMTGALARIAALKPVTYKWRATGANGEGFIAHELQVVCPDAVSGEKDGVDSEGKPKYQGVDTSFLVATLTAAIQEQQAMIAQLQADIASLKGTA